MCGARASAQRAGLTITEAIVGDEAPDALERDAHARQAAAEAMRRAHEHGWVLVASGDLSGSVVCHAEAFFESMAAAERSARAVGCPPGTVLEWSPGLTPDRYEPGGDLVPVPLAGRAASRAAVHAARAGTGRDRHRRPGDAVREP